MKRVFFIVFCMLLLAGNKMNGQNQKLMTLTEETVAMFRCSVTIDNYTFYGLSSPKALEEVSIGTPITHRAVTLRDLSQYTEEQDPNTIVNDMGYVTVPLLNSNNQVETYALLNKRDNEYASTGIGNDFYTERFLALKDTSQEELTLLRIPALNVAYGATTIEGVLHLIPLTGERQKSMEPRPASEVFASLAKQLPSSGEDVPH